MEKVERKVKYHLQTLRRMSQHGRKKALLTRFVTDLVNTLEPFTTAVLALKHTHTHTQETMISF